MTRRLLGAAALLCAAQSACIYADVRTPLAYRSPTPIDVAGQLGKEVSGEACNHSVLWLVAWGDGGYEAAVENAKQSAKVQLLADVRSDISVFSVVAGIYARQCTVVRANVAQLGQVPGTVGATAPTISAPTGAAAAPGHGPAVAPNTGPTTAPVPASPSPPR